MWDAIEDDTVLPKEDRHALEALIRSTLPKMHSMLAEKVGAREAWAAIKTQRLNNDCVSKANAQRLQAEFESIVFSDGEGSTTSP